MVVLVVVAQMPLVALVAKEIMVVQARHLPFLLEAVAAAHLLPQVVAQVALAVLVVTGLHQVFLAHLLPMLEVAGVDWNPRVLKALVALVVAVKEIMVMEPLVAMDSVGLAAAVVVLVNKLIPLLLVVATAVAVS